MNKGRRAKRRAERKAQERREQEKLNTLHAKRRALQEADEEAGIRRPRTHPSRVSDADIRRLAAERKAAQRKERNYLRVFRSSKLDGSPPRAVNKLAGLMLTHKRGR